MIRRPPRSTLFPYTDALPISVPQLACGVALGSGGDDGAEERDAVDAENRGAHVHPHLVHAGVVARLQRLVVDRKSTRLNSSHANISYAVFCLKKKKQIMIDVF